MANPFADFGQSIGTAAPTGTFGDFEGVAKKSGVSQQQQREKQAKKKPKKNPEDPNFFADIFKTAGKIGGDIVNSTVKSISNEIKAVKNVGQMVSGANETQRQVVEDYRKRSLEALQNQEISKSEYDRINKKFDKAAEVNLKSTKRTLTQTKDRVKTAAEVAGGFLDVATLGGGGTVAKQAVQQGAKQLLTRTGKSVAEGALVGGAYGSLGALREKGNATDINDLAVGAGTGVAIGGVVGGAIPLAGAGVNRLRGKQLPTQVLPSTNRPSGELQKAVEDANNAGDFALAKKLEAQLPDQAMNPDAVMNPERRMQLLESNRAMASARGKKVTQKAEDSLNTPVDGIAQRQIQAAISEKNKYKQGTVKKITDTIRREALDPLNRFAREDRAYAKKMGTTKEKLIREGRSLPILIENARYNQEIVKQFTTKKQPTGFSLEDIIQKYGEDTPESQLFNTYLNNRFTAEVFDKSGKNIQSQYDINAIKESVKRYESTNPGATIDAQTIKSHADNMLDYAADARVISKKDADFVKNHYQSYTPLSRVFSEDLVRPEVTGGIGVSVGKQRILQNLEGSDIPLDVSFGAAIDKTKTAVGQSLKNKVDIELLRRHQEGAFDGNLIINPETSRAAKALRETHKTLTKRGESIRTDLGKKVGQLRVQNAYTAPLRKQAVKETRNYLKSTAEDPGEMAAVKSLSDNDLLDVFKYINGDKEIDALREQLIKKGAKSQTLLDTVEQLKNDYKQTDAQRQQTFDNLVNVRQDSPTGKNLITGQLDGEKFAIEAAPDFSKALGLLNQSQAKDMFMTAVKGGADIQKSLFTGVFAPVFQAVNAVKNQGIMFTNARGLSPFGARAIASVFKPGGQFMQELKMRGARPETFTQAVSDAAITAEQIASKKGLGSKVRYAKNQPVMAAKDFFRSLNRFGAFLGNTQRKQVAKGAYLNAVNRDIPKEEALNVAAQAYNDVLGNFNRVSTLAKSAEPIMLYSGATQAGLRSVFTAMRDRPIETGAKMAGLVTTLGGFGSLSLSSQAGQDYYKDMYENKQAYNVDNYITYVAPWAKRDEKTGKWSGIFKTPIAPDFRPLNKAINEQVYKVSNGQGVDPAEVAKGIFNFSTGGVLAETDGSTNITPAGIWNNNPGVRIAYAKAGVDIDTGEAIPKEDNANTSQAGKTLGGVLGISGNQADKIIKQGGLSAKVIQGKSDNPAAAVAESFSNQFSGAYSSNKMIQDKLTTSIESKSKVSDQITEALKKRDYKKANKLANTYNKEVDGIAKIVKDRDRKLTDKQKKLLKTIKFPTDGGYLSQRSIDSRLKQ